MQTQKINKNIKFSLINYILVNVLKFLVRMAFVYSLSIEYLGINGLFTNILSMLSLAELGIGPAIVYSLYKPLAVKNKEIIKSIMNLFKQVYIFVGFIILILGLILYPWLDFFIKGNSNIEDLGYFYLIFVMNTSISYFWSYKRNLLIADQKQYVVNIYQTVVQIVIALLQIIILILIPSYWGFVILMLLGTIVENIYIAKRTDRDYPYLNEKALPLEKRIKETIIKNTKAMILHKIGGMVVFSSANIVLSKFVGLVAVGLYSNYFMVIAAMNTFASKFFEAITASIGNMVIIEEEKEKLKVFKIIEFVTAFQASLISIGLYVLFNTFIQLWLSEKYLFDKPIVIGIIVSFYLMYMRKAILMFRDACGLFWYDRYKPVAEAIINLSVSVYLAYQYGTIGVICGGIISTLLTCFWVEPYILFKYGIKYSLRKYYMDYFCYTLVTIFGALIMEYLCKQMFYKISLINFILEIVMIVIFTTIIWKIVFKNKDECIYIYNKINQKIKLILIKIFK